MATGNYGKGAEIERKRGQGLIQHPIERLGTQPSLCPLDPSFVNREGSLRCR